MSCSFSKSLRVLRYRLLSHILWGEQKRRYKKKYRELKDEKTIQITDLSNKEKRIYDMLTQMQKSKRG